jgi:multidrug efflux pump subunit AcrB
LSLKESLLQTIQSRFVPIFLTSSTTIAGLITLALKDELWG